MLSLAAAALLATAASPTSHSLLTRSPDRPVSVRLLLAQAPAEVSPDASGAPTPPPLAEDLDARARELTQQIAMLQSEIRTVDTNWPAGSLVMAYSGYVLSPLLLLGIPLIIVGMGSSDDDDAGSLLGLGVGMTVGGVAGVGLLIAGIITGSKEANLNRSRREEMVRERIRLEDELRDVKARRDARGALQTRTWTPRPSLPLVAFAF
ncbi:hypothetical protein [Corallococcus macrosporus]|uniref:Uncharacterized protein n=2 Tax=Myxococcaceae TaxID=31 RepID=A0A250JNQ5_9BACT|nr:hypothetical protein [Corallococcus macrosporus]AEI62599.1 hypothetical protein LILAB_03370 [Corallococcus macrosporus]ATB45499.1 hypothetical protein MYMAC_001084 [Corallococcus macrosporus DSM 14697]